MTAWGADQATARVLLIVLTTLALLVMAVTLTPRVDPVGEVDAVVVLGGGGGERVMLGRQLAVEQRVPLVVYAQGIPRAVERGLRCGHEMRCVQPTPSRTDGEARTSLALAREEGWDRIAVVTSTFHANRSRTLFRHCFEDRVDVAAAPADGSAGLQLWRFAREFVAHAAAVTVRRAC